MSDQSRRCRVCEALVSEDAAWCGQCFSPLSEPEPEPEPQRVAVAVAGEPGDAATTPRLEPHWPCPVCGGENAIALDACETCGTPFAQSMRGVQARPEVDPNDAVRASLLFPGLGHRRLGLPLEGLVRGLLFAVTLGMTILLGFVASGSGATSAVFLLLLLATLAIYAGSAFESRRIALGGDVLVSSRALLWYLVVVILAAVVLLAVAVVTASRG